MCQLLSCLQTLCVSFSQSILYSSETIEYVFVCGGCCISILQEPIFHISLLGILEIRNFSKKVFLKSPDFTLFLRYIILVFCSCLPLCFHLKDLKGYLFSLKNMNFIIN
jgi:hypothetical protein